MKFLEKNAFYILSEEKRFRFRHTNYKMNAFLPHLSEKNKLLIHKIRDLDYHWRKVGKSGRYMLYYRKRIV